MKQDEFKVGDTVWCVINGKGTVILASTGEAYPVVVQFKNRRDSYTEDGKMFMGWGARRALYFSEPKIEGATERPFIPTLIGKNVVIDHARHGIITLTIKEESADEILGTNGVVFNKDNCLSIYELGEKIK
jgi:hypothetical protein